ncbi:MAG: hypothetical protein JRN62_10090 [Nitrososphaerota archaeon]|jgi:hypothetical protein|nr:hypothetical protein [Nitrososphaerota archaeon]
MCPNCKRLYTDPVKFHRHLLDELRVVKEEFDQLARVKGQKLAMLNSLWRIAEKGVSP